MVCHIPPLAANPHKQVNHMLPTSQNILFVLLRMCGKTLNEPLRNFHECFIKHFSFPSEFLRSCAKQELPNVARYFTSSNSRPSTLTLSFATVF